MINHDSSRGHRKSGSGRRGFTRLLAAAALLLAMPVVSPLVAPAQATSPDIPDWQVMATPGVNANIALTAISCPAVDDCTAVGSAGNGKVAIEHYDGTTWTLQTIDVGTGAGLDGVSCPAAGECTAVGYSGSGALIMHESSGSWSVSTAPAVSDDYGLRKVSCADDTHCVAVGSYYGGNSYQTYADVWSGADWSYSSTPSPGDDVNELEDVSCASATTCVAVGYATSSYSSPGEQFLVATYDGASWTQQSIPYLGTITNELWGVACIADDDCTAVGHAFDYTIGNQTAVEHWDGTGWSAVDDVPYVGPLYAISCTALDDCAAVGGQYDTAALSFDGTAWSESDAIDPGGYQNGLNDVACPSASACFAVGYRRAMNRDPRYPLIETTLDQPQPVVAGSSNTDVTTTVLYGSGFTGASAVHIGTVAATAFSVDSDTQLTVTVPDGTPAGDVTVTTPAGTSQVWFADWYVAPPVVTSVSPGSGSDEGGDTITITGTGFTGSTEVYFDGGEAGYWDADDFTVDSDTQITAITPYIDDWDGTTDLRVVGPGGTSAYTDADAFTFGTATALTLDSARWTIYPTETTAVTATVDPAPDGGTVSFADGDGPIDGCADVDVDVDLGTGTATCEISYRSVRHATITATYSGYEDQDDRRYLPATAEHQLVVDQQPTTAFLDLPDSPTAGSPVRIGMTISPLPDGGTVAFIDDGTMLPGCAARPIDEGYAFCDVTYNAFGDHDLVASYTGNADYSPATASGSIHVDVPATATSTSTALTAQPGQPTAGALVIYRASVSPVPDSGTVTFADGGEAIAGCAARPIEGDGTAACTTTAGAVGEHSITAAYSGDDVFAASTGQATVTVSAADGGGAGGPVATTATVSASDDPTAGQPVTYTITVTPAPDTGDGAGTATFADGGQAIRGCVELDLDTRGTASCTTTYATTGEHAITAGYSGDSSYAPATARTQAAIEAPASKTGTSTSLAAAPRSAITGQLVTLTATVDPAPDGASVEFDDNGSAVDGCAAVAVDVQSGIARCQVAYGTAGAHAITASYSGDMLYASSDSAQVDVTVTAPSSGGGGGLTAVTVTVGVNPAQPEPGEEVVYTADLEPGPNGGAITFTDGGDPVAHCSNVPVVAGSAQCTTTYAAGGTHHLIASFTGDATHSASTSAPLTVSVQASTATAFTGGPDSVSPGEAATYTVTVTPAPTGGTVGFADGGSPIPGCDALLVDTTTGTASCTASFDVVGTHTLIATFSGVTGFVTSSTTWNVTVLDPTTVQVSTALAWDWQFAYIGSYECGTIWAPADCDYSVFKPAWDVTLAATVVPSAGAGSLGGTVTFASAPDGSSLGCSAVIFDGYGRCTVPGVPAGVQEQVTAAYSGDANHLPATSAITEVDLPWPTTTTLNASATAVTTGAQVTLSAQIRATLDDNGSWSPVGEGTVTYTDAGADVPGCSAVPVAAGATCTTSFAAAGPHVIQASYSGTATELPSSGQVEVDASDATAAPPQSGGSTTPAGTPPVTTGPTPPTPPKGVTGVVTGVSADPSGHATGSSAGVDVSASGEGAFTLGQYAGRPLGTSRLVKSGAYFDLKTSSDSAFDSITVKDCNLGGATRLYFWDGTTWVAASNQRYDGSVAPPCVTVTINAKTRPALSQLTGTVFAAGPTKLRETPVLTATSAARGRVTAVVRTSPAVAHRFVGVYRVVKRHGHKARLKRLRLARTTTSGRAVLRLRLTPGTSVRLRARMAGKDYVQKLSRTVTVRVRLHTPAHATLRLRAE